MRIFLWLATVFALAGLPALAASTSTSALPETTTLSGSDLLQATIGDDAGGWQTRKITVENAAGPLKAAMDLGTAAAMDGDDFLQPSGNLGDLDDPVEALENLGVTPLGEAVVKAADQVEALRAMEIWYDLFAYATFDINVPLVAGAAFAAGDDGAACVYAIVAGPPGTDREVQAGGTPEEDRYRIRDAINANPECGLNAMYAPGGPNDRISLTARVAGAQGNELQTLNIVGTTWMRPGPLHWGQDNYSMFKQSVDGVEILTQRVYGGRTITGTTLQPVSSFMATSGEAYAIEGLMFVDLAEASDLRLGISSDNPDATVGTAIVSFPINAIGDGSFNTYIMANSFIPTVISEASPGLLVVEWRGTIKVGEVGDGPVNIQFTVAGDGVVQVNPMTWFKLTQIH